MMWIHHRCTCAPNPEPPFHLPPIPLKTRALCEKPNLHFRLRSWNQETRSQGGLAAMAEDLWVSLSQNILQIQGAPYTSPLHLCLKMVEVLWGAIQRAPHPQLSSFSSTGEREPWPQGHNKICLAGKICYKSINT